MENKTIYKRVKADQVILDRDLVIMIFPGGSMPMAKITYAKGSPPSTPLPVGQALKMVSDELALEPYYSEIVIVDEGNRWQDEWGILIDHPTRTNAPDN